MRWVFKHRSRCFSTLYDTLEVSSSADGSEIKRRFQRLVKQHHPDLGATNPDLVAKLIEAYQVRSYASQR